MRVEGRVRWVSCRCANFVGEGWDKDGGEGWREGAQEHCEVEEEVEGRGGEISGGGHERDRTTLRGYRSRSRTAP